MIRTFVVALSALVLAAAAAARAECVLNSPGGQIQHVVYIQFDNVHFTRDNPNVPSDLEQMPNLLNFLSKQGTLLTNHHTPLISHTADDILTSLTGVYPDRHGQAVSNSYVIFTPTGFSFPSSFTYWTDPVNTTTDTAFNLITAGGQNAPAPWVPFTRAGCNVGAVSIADMEMENTTSDLVTVFGAGSSEVIEATTDAASPDPKVKAQPAADFEGISIHCAAADPLCAAANGGVADVLRQEPGGYSGFNGLFGHKFVAPAINSGDAMLLDLAGNVITDSRGNTGFPGFGPITASQTLGYVAAMLEHHVPVTFAYISDAHDDPATGLASGPGQADYVARLAAYNTAWGAFFSRLAADGIDQSNTLFIITADEGDHFAGGAPSPAGCDGIHTPCTYSKIGEIDTDLALLLGQQNPALNVSSRAFSYHFDMAPACYIKGQPDTGDPTLRDFEKAAAKLTAVSPFTGKTDALTRYLVDHPAMSLLHMITADPLRTPSFVMFADPDYFFVSTGKAPAESPGFAWNHGGVAPEINTTFLGLVGPGVSNGGITDDIWSDHTDIRPTMLSLVGLQDDYSHDGRVLVEALSTDFIDFHHGKSSHGGQEQFIKLAQAYKQINAPVAELGMTVLGLSTQALAGDDQTYTNVENEITTLTVRRNALASEMIGLLEGAAFQGQSIDPAVAEQLVRQANELLKDVRRLHNR